MIGLKVGHAVDEDLKSGVTVLVPDRPAVAAVSVAGGAPATRETDLLRPGNLVERVDAIVLSGGSVFGLAAADAVVDWLAGQARGFPVAGLRVPIVPAACIFDLANGGDKSAITGAAGRSGEIYRRLGADACAALGRDFASGSLGAGTGATTANLKGGFGIASAKLLDGEVLACAVVNAVGRVTIGDGPHFRSAAFEVGSEFGSLGFPRIMPDDAADPVAKAAASPAESTIIGTIVTSFALDRAEALRLAIAGQDGIAVGVFPAHTLFDGDTVFALATGETELQDRSRSLVALGAAAAGAMARAVALAVYAARPVPGDIMPTWRERHAKAR
jgi:L-aminopeptidase/D-esterase-like protein